MQDRIPTKPNRYAVYDDAHNFVRYEYHERADEPTQTGDAINKANLLPDAVATALGLTGNPQVKDALDKLKTLADIGISRAQIATGSYTGTGTFGGSNKNSLTFSFTPTVLILMTNDDPYLLANGYLSLVVLARPQGTFYTGTDNTSKPVFVSWGTTVSYFGGDARAQFNESGVAYKYVAIG